MSSLEVLELAARLATRCIWPGWRAEPGLVDFKLLGEGGQPLSANSRQMIVIARKPLRAQGVDSVLKHIPCHQVCLVPPTSRSRKPLGGA